MSQFLTRLIRALSAVSLLIFSSALTPALSDPVPGRVGEITASEGSRPFVVVIFDEECQIWCKQVHPLVSKLEKDYSGRVKFVELNATGSHLEISRKRAKELGIGKFFNDALEYVPDVAVFDSKSKLLRELSGPKSMSTYKSAVELAVNNTTPKVSANK